MTASSLLFDPSEEFPVSELCALRDGIGNKALGLARLGETGIEIAQWASLRSDFFAPWLLEIESEFPFAELVANSPLDDSTRTALQASLAKLYFSEAQSEALAKLSEILGKPANGFAVRSSSQYEDMEAHSFAGIYKSLLGVQAVGLKSAISECFFSSYEDKALEYIARKKLSIKTPAFSVIVQHQINCAVSGISFSIHPTNNHYDVAYLNSNFGLGESIASGTTTPDIFEVNKLSTEIVASRCGDKSNRTILGDSGFSEAVEASSSGTLSLNNDQVGKIVELTKQAEEFIGRPVEIEWGIEEDKLFLFQVRPITRWVPLPSEMLTETKETPVLYMDRALSDGMTMNRAASHLGLDVIKGLEMSLYERYIGRINRELSPKESLLFHAGGRIYANLSIVLCMTTANKLVKTLEPLNGQLFQVLGGVDLLRYTPGNRPPYLKNWKLKLLPRVVWHARSIIGKTRLGNKNPVKLKELYDRDIQSFREKLDTLDGMDMSLPAYAALIQEEIVDILANAFIPALILVNNYANKALDNLFPSPSEQEKVLIDNMKKGFADNIVVKMGKRMRQVGEVFHSTGIEQAYNALHQIQSGHLDQSLCAALDTFLLEFGHRGPNEMDIAQARYKDDLEFTLSQMLAVSEANNISMQEDAAHNTQKELRIRAYKSLQENLSGKNLRKLKKIYNIYESFGAMRDTPKHIILLGLQKIRERSLVEGQTLFEQNKISVPNDIFNLRMEEIANPTLDHKAAAHANREFRSLQSDCVVAFPSIIDSRGYIPGNDQIPSTADDVMIGIPVSPGVVEGTVKILNGDESISIYPSDIIVAYVTDPGLTPSFNNAAGVVLEIGGALQHGAVVARELGIPCVTSILGVTQLLKSGDRVEVNGNNGSVRLLS